MVSIAGRTGVVTGGASGIGAACAALLESEGARVARWDRQAGEGVILCDVTDPASIDSAMRETRVRYGSPSLLVAAAGIADGKPILDMDAGTWDRVLGVNLKGVM